MGSNSNSVEKINTDPLTALANTIGNQTLTTTARELLALQALTATWDTPETPIDPRTPTSTPGPVTAALITSTATNTTEITTEIKNVIDGVTRVNASQTTQSGYLGHVTNTEVTHGPVLDPDTQFTVIEGIEQLTDKQQVAFREPLENNSFTFTTKETQATERVTGALLFTGRPDTETFTANTAYSDTVSISREIRQGVDVLLIEPSTTPSNREWDVPTLDTDTATVLLQRGETYTPDWTAAAESCLEQFYHTATEKAEPITGASVYVPVPSDLTRTAMKLAVAHACLRESESVDAGDVTTVTTLLNTAINNYMSGWASGPEQSPHSAAGRESSATQDWENTSLQDPVEQDNAVADVKRIIASVEADHDNGAPIETVIERAVRDGLLESVVTDIIDDLRTKGEIYEPKADHLRTT